MGRSGMYWRISIRWPGSIRGSPTRLPWETRVWIMRAVSGSLPGMPQKAKMVLACCTWGRARNRANRASSLRVSSS